MSDVIRRDGNDVTGLILGSGGDDGNVFVGDFEGELFFVPTWLVNE